MELGQKIFILLFQNIILLNANVITDDFLKNWQLLSEEKPIKCKSSTDENFVKNYWRNYGIEGDFRPILETYKCKENETSIAFSFKGGVKDFQLSGPGKLKIGKP